MKRAIRILTIIGLATALISLLAGIVVILCQKPLVELLLGWEQQVFSIPIAILLSLAWAVLFRTLLCLVCGNRRIGIWAEILLLAINNVVFPVASHIVSTVESLTISQYNGVEAVASYSNIMTLASYVTSFAGLGGTLCLVACGMSIAYKCYLKRNLRNESNLPSQSDI